MKTNLVCGSVGACLLLTVSLIYAQAPARRAPADAVQDAQTTRAVERTRPEQQLTEHDKSGLFDPLTAPDSSPVLKTQPEEGKIKGFDFARDPLNAKKPMQSP